jgi:capsular exopolysaccharide synthesis family protein
MNHSVENPVPPNANYPATFSRSNLPSTELRDPVPEFDDSAHLQDYLDIVLRHKWAVLTVLCASFITMLIVSLIMKPVYRATGRLELSMQAPKVTKFDDLMGTQRMQQTREFILTQVQLLQSQTLARRVIDKLHLEENPVFNPDFAKQHQEPEGIIERMRTTFSDNIKGFKDAIKELFHSGEEEEGSLDAALPRLLLQQSIEGAYTRNMDVLPERDTTIVNISFSSTDPTLTRDIVNTHIQEFTSWQMDKRIDAAGSAREQLEKQLEVARINLEKAEKRLSQFAQKAGIVSLDSNLNLIYRQLEEMNNALSKAQSDRVAKESLYQQANLENINSQSAVTSNSLIQNLRQDLAKVEAEYQEYYSTFKDDYPKLKNLKAKMQDIERRIATEEKRILTTIRNDYLGALAKENSLSKKAEEMKGQALDLNNQATEYKILEREVETSKFIHQSLMERAKEIDAKVGTDLGNVQVIDYAILPLTPYKPNIRLNLLLAVVCGLLGGVGLAFFLEYLDNTVKRVDEISDRFGIPVIGVLPLADTEDLSGLDRLVLTRPLAAFSEAIRTTRVSIQLSSTMDHPPKMILVTSTGPSEGKSTIATNLALAFSLSDDRVVLIDADLRKPRLHRIFSGNGGGDGRQVQNGLSHVLSGMCKLNEAIQETDVVKLHFLRAGPMPPNPAELLASNQMKKLLIELGTLYDRIIIDSPPASGFADVLVLGNFVDGVILVSNLGQTHREALRVFRKSIVNVGGHLLGAIVNKLDLGYHYGGYYSRYYSRYYRYYHSYYHPRYRAEGEKLPEAMPENVEGGMKSE